MTAALHTMKTPTTSAPAEAGWSARPRVSTPLPGPRSAELLARQEARAESFPLDLSELQREIDSALEATSEVLSRATHMLALVSAPQLQTTTVKHVEVLLLNPRTVMAVVITSTGGVAKRVVAVEDQVDGGLAKWGSEYLNERLAGLGVLARPHRRSPCRESSWHLSPRRPR